MESICNTGMPVYEKIYDLVEGNLHRVGVSFDYKRNTFLCDVGMHPKKINVSVFLHLSNPDFIEASYVATLHHLPDEKTAKLWEKYYSEPTGEFRIRVLRSLEKSSVVARQQVELFSNAYFQQKKGICYHLLGNLYLLTDKSNLRELGKKLPMPIQKIIRRIFI